MKERPLLFSSEMVRAILQDRKTQTRRVMRPQPSAGVRREIIPIGSKRSSIGLEDGHGYPLRCPYGKPNDRLWVRETWLQNAFDVLLYKADMEGCETRGMGWHSGRFMPRWASRITLEIVSVRVEQVQSISEEDAKAEGIANVRTWAAYSMRDKFWALWDDINAKRGYPWESNPWVWVITFKRVTL